MNRRFSKVWLLLVALALGAEFALAQPFAAAGGFDRPLEVATTNGTTRVALAGSDGTAQIFWSDNSGIYRRGALAPEAEATRVVEGRGVRELTATEVLGDPAIAWARRDLATARTHHWLSWRGEERMVLESHQAYSLNVVETAGGPGVLIGRLEDGVNVLRLIAWDGSQSVVRRSDDSLVQYVARLDEAGVVHVAWLEGFTERGAIGFAPSGEWNAFSTTLDLDGEAAPAVELGPARYQGSESQVVVALAAEETRVLWPGPDGEVLLGGPGVEPLVVGRGSPVGLSDDGRIFWTEGFAIRSRSEAGAEAINVSWSPITVTQGELVESEGQLFLAWYGPARGGERRVYSANDLQPFQPGWRDRVAAAMQWSPWNFWEALAGQLLGALFAGVLISMVLSPVLWAVAAAAVRTRWANDPTIAGISLGAVTLLALLALAGMRSRLPEATHIALFGSLPELVGTLLLASLLTWGIRRRTDSEQLIGVLGSAWLFVFLGSSTLAFLTFQSWLEFWTGLG